MKRLAGIFAALAIAAPLGAWAVEGYVVDDVSLQAGPDTDYPQITELNAGTPVDIHGCIDGYTWCDVTVNADRGWVPGTFLEEEYNNQPVFIVEAGPRIGIPVVSFSLDAYWGAHYHDRPWFAERTRFVGHVAEHHAPPRPHVDRAPPIPQGGAERAQARTQQQTSQGMTEDRNRTTEENRNVERNTAQHQATPRATEGTSMTNQQQTQQARQQTHERSQQPEQRQAQTTSSEQRGGMNANEQRHAQATSSEQRGSANATSEQQRRTTLAEQHKAQNPQSRSEMPRSESQSKTPPKKDQDEQRQDKDKDKKDGGG
ncbi:MAG TPA: SH3 domain-containing protein [Rudaea sp.]|nr:SH3 domain-containing protein [Rudaea sp.]